jgi:WbqC-like protein family
MKCVILQPSYIPWRGYFHQIQKADIFVFYDDVQYDRRGWRNRNLLKGPDGSQWLTIPVLNKGSYFNHTPINEIRIDWDRSWNKKHWATINQFYNRAPYLRLYRNLLEDFYSRHPRLLADFTIELTIALAKELGITTTKFLRSSDLPAHGTKTDRLVSILRQIGANHYITGPSAKAYLDEQQLQSEGISLEYMLYNYPEYPQLGRPFDPYVSIIDLLFMTGPQAPQYIWGSDEPVSPEGILPNAKSA